MEVYHEEISHILASIFLLTFVTAGASFATSILPYWVEVDVAPYAGSDIELELDLWDNNYIIGDSCA